MSSSEWKRSGSKNWIDNLQPSGPRLKCHYDQILDIHFFFHIFVHNRSFLNILPNFSLLRTLEFAVYEALFPRQVMAAINFPCPKC